MLILSKKLKPVIFLLILLLSAFALYALCKRLVPQIYYVRAVNTIHDKNHQSAVTYLEKAVTYKAANSKIFKALGKAYYNLGTSKPAKEAFVLAKKSKNACEKAVLLNPIDAEAVYHLALTETRLEKLYPFIHDYKSNPYDPVPFFQKTIQLRPNSATYHHTFVRYLHQTGRKKQLLEAVTNLAKIYPPVYSYLKKEPFWSPAVQEAVKKGLLQAMDERVNVQAAHNTISSILQKENKWDKALHHYKLALDHQRTVKEPRHYIQLGRLYVKTEAFGEAEKNFIMAFSISREKEKTLQNIFNIYKSNKNPEELHKFYQTLNSRFSLSTEMHISFARSLADLKQYSHARKVLNDLIQKDPRAETFYWLARIAEKEQNWDAMELAIQKAALLDRENSDYHLLFAKVLNRMKKYDRAEKEAGLAIQYSKPPRLADLYSYRAAVKRNKKDYEGAIEDYMSAIALKPDTAYFYAHIAELHKRLGQTSNALNYYQQAINLDPDNAKYQKKYNELKNGK